MALATRKGHAASVRRQSRQRLRSERRYGRNWLVRFIGTLYELEVSSETCHGPRLGLAMTIGAFTIVTQLARVVRASPGGGMPPPPAVFIPLASPVSPARGPDTPAWRGRPRCCGWAGSCGSASSFFRPFSFHEKIPPALVWREGVLFMRKNQASRRNAPYIPASLPSVASANCVSLQAWNMCARKWRSTPRSR